MFRVILHLIDYRQNPTSKNWREEARQGKGAKKKISKLELCDGKMEMRKVASVWEYVNNIERGKRGCESKYYPRLPRER